MKRILGLSLDGKRGKVSLSAENWIRYIRLRLRKANKCVTVNSYLLYSVNYTKGDSSPYI